MDSVQTIKKDGFLRLIVFTIVKIMSTDKEIIQRLFPEKAAIPRKKAIDPTDLLTLFQFFVYYITIL
jgi:hypothetical protein